MNLRVTFLSILITESIITQAMQKKCTPSFGTLFQKKFVLTTPFNYFTLAFMYFSS